MSALNSLFNRASLGVRCKTCLNLAISRIKLLRNKREVQLKHMHKEISQFLQSGQEAIARIRVEHVIREQNILAAYEVLELFCEFVLARIPILEVQRGCPTELQEAIASIIFASPRCSDLPELLQIRNLFTAKYGKEFVSAASELRPDSSVNRTIIEKLSVKTPPADIKLKVLKAIAKEYNLEWDSSSTEAELGKRHEDLLDGPKTLYSHTHANDSSVDNLLSKDGIAASSLTEDIQRIVPQEAPTPGINNSAFTSTTSLIHTDKKEPDGIQREMLSADEKPDTNRSSDALERARAAIAAAERASAAARAAAKLVNVRMSHPASSTKNCF